MRWSKVLIVGICALVASTSHAANTTYTYDPLGRIVKATNSAGFETAYTYDAADNRTSKTVIGGVPSAGGGNNLWPNADNGLLWASYPNTTVAAGGTLLGAPAFKLSAIAAGSVGARLDDLPVVNGETVTFEFTVDIPIGHSVFVGILGTIGDWWGWGANSETKLEVVSGSADVYQSYGGLWHFQNSGSGPVRMRMTRQVIANDTYDLMLVHQGLAANGFITVANPVVKRGINHWPNANTGAWPSYPNTTVTANGTLLGAPAFNLIANTAGSMGAAVNDVPVTNGQTVTFEFTVDTYNAVFLGISGTVGEWWGWGANSETTLEVVSGSAHTHQYYGSVWSFQNTGSGPMRMRMTRQVVANDNYDFIIYQLGAPANGYFRFASPIITRE